MMARPKKKADASSGKLVGILIGVDKKIDALDDRLEIQGRQAGRFEGNMVSVGARIKRFETQVDKRMSAFEDRMNETEGAIKNVAEWMATKADLRDYATKNDIERMRDEILEPLIKAVDKDAEMVVSHEKRIVIIERKIGIASH